MLCRKQTTKWMRELYRNYCEFGGKMKVLWTHSVLATEVLKKRERWFPQAIVSLLDAFLLICYVKSPLVSRPSPGICSPVLGLC